MARARSSRNCSPSRGPEVVPLDVQRNGATPGGRLRSTLTSHVGYKLSALFFATVLWVVVSAEEPTERFVRVRFAPDMDSGLVLGEAPELRALVSGRARELLKLYDRPPIVRRAFGATTPGEMQVEIRPADVDLPPGVEAMVRDVQPRTLTLRFARAPRASPRAAGR